MTAAAPITTPINYILTQPYIWYAFRPASNRTKRTGATSTLVKSRAERIFWYLNRAYHMAGGYFMVKILVNNFSFMLILIGNNGAN